MSGSEENRPLPSRSASLPKPKGILKNAQQPSNTAPAHSLQWDEENIALTEINKDSLMKITEPKTPFVRYNALTDEIEGDIPHLNLSSGYSSGGEAGSPPLSISPTNADTSGPSSRRTSISSSGRPGTPGRPGSGTSSRSTSFNLPNEARRDLRLDGTVGDEIEVEPEMDEETAAKHAAFVRARKGHYSNEAEAMKRAAQLMAEEDDEASTREPSDAEGDDESEEGGAPSSRTREIPPVPPLPPNINGKAPSTT
ncbi:hypothetical protein CC1G_01429 [Coprinopsis cinerea okayama7|uniref:Uncharacterized protein n=1 Tax=Coprinopsis cinerea (strain Okayama-7 / 130 / ATCC MYA-4618 / FGSC 9003) TaxID=240176 RepID=A8NYT5_COPC7|nr:hypothetical protein CC1G_01429 [Coprinopsis cinerea okayama7\|eukprot:XP_001837517.1 hypothetical protein CC1G_01429 [Coprinopsis cinerea okayama7\